MAFGVATVVTNGGFQTAANRMVTAPSRNPIKYVAMGVGAHSGAHTAVATDTALQSEVESRTSGTESNPSNPVYQVAGTVTATASRAVDEAGLFDAASTGNMGTSATFDVISLNTDDSIAFTWQITFS